MPFSVALNQPRFDSDDSGGLGLPGSYPRYIVRENSPLSLALSLGAEPVRVTASRRVASARVVTASTTPAVTVRRGAPSTPVVSPSARPAVKASSAPVAAITKSIKDTRSLKDRYDVLTGVVQEKVTPAQREQFFSDVTALTAKAQGTTLKAWNEDLKRLYQQEGFSGNEVVVGAKGNAILAARASSLYPQEWSEATKKTPWYKQAAGKLFIAGAAIWTAGVGAALIAGAGGVAAATGAAGTAGTAGVTGAVTATALPALVAPAVVTATTGGGILAAVGGAGGIAKGLVTGLSIYASVEKVKQAKETAKAAQAAGSTAGLQDAYAQYVQAAKNAGYNPVPYSTFSSWAAGDGTGTPPVGEPLAAGEAGLQSSFLPLLLIGAVGVVLLTRGK